MGKKDVFRVGTRESQLAMVQTTTIVNRLKEFHPEKQFEIVTMTTLGDQVLDSALGKIGENGLFTKELETALLEKKLDFIVHSLKDVPTSLPEGIAIACVYKRDSVYDAVVVHTRHAGKVLEDLPEGSIVGTSSVRRMSQLLAKHPTLKFENIRGNLNSRFRQLEVENKYDAIILAEAGLVRIGWKNKIAQVLDESLPMYTAGQGAIGVECRLDDMETCNILSCIHDKETALQIVAERSFLRALEGGCGSPACINSQVTAEKVSLVAAVHSVDAKRHEQATLTRAFPIKDRRKSKYEVDSFKTYIGVLGNEVVGDEELAVAFDCGFQLAKDLLCTEAAEFLLKAKAERRRQKMQNEKKECIKKEA